MLNVSHADALGATTAAISGSSGVSGGPVYVQSGAALEIQGGIALSGTGGKTLYVNGTGVGSAGAVRSVSGSNSNAGQVILQSDSTIGVDADSLTLSGKISGSGALTKVGAGILSLTGANTFSGATNVNAGQVIVSGALNGTAAVSITSGATLQVDGVIRNGAAVSVTGSLKGSGSMGAVSVSSGGTVAPGNAGVGNLNVASLTMSSGAHLSLSTSGTGAGQTSSVTSSGSITLNGATLDLAVAVTYTPTFSVTGDFNASDRIYLTLGASSVSGTFVNVVAGYADSNFGTINQFTAANGSQWAVFYGAKQSTGALTGGNDIALYAVPEPGTWALLVGSLGMLGFVQRLRRRRI